MEKTNSYSRTASRGDGLETRAQIIQCAGKLIAANGYASTTSKAICQAAKVNMAAVNYHFGSREGLYMAVLQESHTYLMNLDVLNKLYTSRQSPEKKIAALIDLYINSVLKEKNWYVKVWARELVEPSPSFQEILQSSALPKLNLVVLIFAQYLELAVNDPRLYSCIFSTMAPFVMLYLGPRHFVQQHLDKIFNEDELISSLKSNAMNSLSLYKKLYAEKSKKIVKKELT